jgi:hypothetical protein
MGYLACSKRFSNSILFLPFFPLTQGDISGTTEAASKVEITLVSSGCVSQFLNDLDGSKCGK